MVSCFPNKYMNEILIVKCLPKLGKFPILTTCIFFLIGNNIEMVEYQDT